MNATICISENAERQAALTDHLRTSRASIAQTKLTLARLRRCYSSPRARAVLDRLCIDMDAARKTLERLDFGRSAGSAS